MKYAGIGARKTPAHVLKQMTAIAWVLRSKGHLLRSGGAKGADLAFEAGVVDGWKTIWRPEHATPEAFEHASRYHPAWNKCGEWAQTLHARNSHIMLGKYLTDPVDFVVCWTPGGTITGGTGQALRIADDLKIPVFNLATDPEARQLFAWLAAQ